MGQLSCRQRDTLSLGPSYLCLMWDSPEPRSHTHLAPVRLAGGARPSHLQRGAGWGLVCASWLTPGAIRLSSTPQVPLGHLLGLGLELFTRGKSQSSTMMKCEAAPEQSPRPPSCHHLYPFLTSVQGWGISLNLCFPIWQMGVGPFGGLFNGLMGVKELWTLRRTL